MHSNVISPNNNNIIKNAPPQSTNKIISNQKNINKEVEEIIKLSPLNSLLNQKRERDDNLIQENKNKIYRPTQTQKNQNT